MGRAHRDPATGKDALGPVIMTWSDASDTHFESIVGDGSLWIFDAYTRKGAEVVRVSERNGRVENTIHLPRDTDRPVLATDDDGLWMGIAMNGGYDRSLPGSPIYHVAAGSNVAKLVFTGGHATFWMVTSGHSLWDDIGTVSPSGGGPSQAIWRFDGPTARRVFHVPTRLPFGISVLGDESEGLWTVASQLRVARQRMPIPIAHAQASRRSCESIPIWVVSVSSRRPRRELEAADTSVSHRIWARAKAPSLEEPSIYSAGTPA
ncbi:MAG: hypothetical protein JWO62_240 [Acidimicrobiaceae bacterium]|nr:hypothetical protein [Acidimicrobiaceae bacterium]